MPMLSEAGTFKCRVMQTESLLGESSTGTPYIGIPVEVIEGPCSGQHITSYHYLSEKAFDNTVKALTKALGWDGDLKALEGNPNIWCGLECQVVTEFEDYKGEAKCKVKWFNSAGGGNGITALDKTKAASLIDRMNKRSKAVAKKVADEGQAGKPAKAERPPSDDPKNEYPEPAPAPPPDTDDDLPF